MTDIIMTVICVGIASGIISLFFDDDVEMSKYIRLVLSLCFLCSVIPGGINLIKNIDSSLDFQFASIDTDISVMTENYFSELAKESAKQLSDELAELIFENTGIKPISVNIQLSVDHQENLVEFSVEKVEISLADDEQQKEIIDYVKSAVGAEPEIAVIYKTE